MSFQESSRDHVCRIRAVVGDDDGVSQILPGEHDRGSAVGHGQIGLGECDAGNEAIIAVAALRRDAMRTRQ